MHLAQCKLPSNLCQTQRALQVPQIGCTGQEGQSAEVPVLVLLLRYEDHLLQMA